MRVLLPNGFDTLIHAKKLEWVLGNEDRRVVKVGRLILEGGEKSVMEKRNEWAACKVTRD